MYGKQERISTITMFKNLTETSMAYSKSLDADVFIVEHGEPVNIQTSDNISVQAPELKAVNLSDNSESEGASFDREHETFCFSCWV